MAAGQSRGKGKALESIAARSGRDPAAIIDSIQAAEKAQAKAEAAKQRAAKVEASKKAAAAKAASKKRGGGGGGGNDDEDETTAQDNTTTEVNQPSQIYSALSPQEQYRFQCYRRSGFASKPIEKFVAKMLVDEANRRFVARRSAVVGLGGGKSSFVSGSSGHNNHNIIMNGEDDEATATVVTDGSDLDQLHSNNNKKRKKQSKRQMLQEESKRRRIAMDQPPPYLLESFINNSGSSSARSSGLNSSSTQGGGGGGVPPPLDQLVVPNSSSEIVAVVSTLAKCYAQRLVSAARRVMDAEEEEGQGRLNDPSLRREATAAAAAKGRAPVTTIAQKPISPQHLLEAHRYRSRAGLDPGFWMADRVVDVRRTKEALSSSSSTHASVGISEAAALGTEDRTRSCFLAAIAAQDAYDEARAKEAEKDVKMDIGKK